MPLSVWPLKIDEISSAYLKRLARSSMPCCPMIFLKLIGMTISLAVPWLIRLDVNVHIWFMTCGTVAIVLKIRNAELIATVLLIKLIRNED